MFSSQLLKFIALSEVSKYQQITVILTFILSLLKISFLAWSICTLQEVA